MITAKEARERSLSSASIIADSIFNQAMSRIEDAVNDGVFKIYFGVDGLHHKECGFGLFRNKMNELGYTVNKCRHLINQIEVSWDEV